VTKPAIILATLISAALLLTLGCGQAEQDAAMEAAQGSMGEAATAAFAEMKTKACDLAKGMVEEWTTKITDLETQKSALPEAAQQALEEPMGVLMEKKDALVAQFGKLEAADENTFADEQKALQESMGEVSEAYNNVMSLL
jgi:hypothetical protein